MELLDDHTRRLLKTVGLFIEQYSIPTQEAAFDLAVELKDYNHRIYGTCKFSTELYDTEFINQLCRHYIYYLEQSLQNPAIGLAEIQLVLPEEQTLYNACNQTGHQKHDLFVIHEIFAQQARRYPLSDAVVASDAKLTYRELDENANRLANFIISKIDVSEGTVIALMTQRNSKMILGMLGILKSGAAFMPIDPEYPAERIRIMLAEAGCTLLLTDEGCYAYASGLPVSSIVNLQAGWGEIAHCPVDALPISQHGDGLAYIMFTSGSTGKPKGVMIPHKGVVNLVKHTDFVSVNHDDRCILVSNYVFDGSIFDIFGALLNGAPVFVPSSETIFSSAALFSYLNQYQINIAFFTTAFFNNLVDADPSFVSGFDKIIIGGEAISIKHVQRAFPFCKNNEVLINAYGPTECSVFSLYHQVKEVPCELSLIPVGKPLPNMHAYVLNRSLQTLPPGITGELYVSGMGVSNGYLNRPEVTTKKFIRAPWDPREILYTTGDLACRLPDGNIHFIGRTDNQVKVRGYRIELGEIEAAICKHPSVNAAVVLCSRSPGGSATIAAFVATGGQALEENELSAFLGDSLPHYMLPYKYHFMTDLTLNENGKIDRKPLQRLLELNNFPASDKQCGVPENELHKKLAMIWQEVLDKPAIGIHDNFFEIGGHSLLAAKIITRVKERLGIEVPLSSIFMKPTIDTMSKIVEAHQPHNEAAPELIRVSREQYRRKPFTK